MAGRPRILIFATRRRGALGFNAENMKELLETCDVETLIGMDPNNLSIGRPAAFGPVKLRSYRERLWQIAYFSKVYPFLRSFDPDYIHAPHFFKGIHPGIRTIISTLEKIKLLPAAAWIARKLMNWTNPYKTLPAHYDLVITYGGLKDPWYDDIARWARENGLPVLCVPTNWDNLPGKPFVERPDFVGVWGTQSVYFARLCHNFPFHNIFQLGVNRFEHHYVAAQTPKAEWRKKLGLPENGTMLLFAGAGETFNEAPLLKQLDAALIEGSLGKDLFAVFKTHPVKRMRGQEHLDCTGDLKKIVKWQDLNESSLIENSALLAAADAVVTPFSTMMLEAASFGKPSLIAFYNDPNFPEHDWNVYARNTSHLPMFVAPWIVKCTHPDNFMAGLKQLLKKIGDPVVSQSARRDYNHCVYSDRYSYGLRLVSAVETILRTPLFTGPKPEHVVVDSAYYSDSSATPELTATPLSCPPASVSPEVRNEL